MYKSIVITAAAVVIASTVSSLAQVSQAQHNRATASLSSEIQANRGQIATNRGAIDQLGEAIDTDPSTCDWAAGSLCTIRATAEGNTMGISNLNQRVQTLEEGVDGRDGEDGQDGARGAAGRDGTNGTNGVNGARGADGRDGVDFNSADHYQAIAGAAALSFANNGGSGLGFGIAGHEDESAAAISYTHEFNSRFSASFGGSTSGTAGGGFKFKF